MFFFAMLPVRYNAAPKKLFPAANKLCLFVDKTAVSV